MPPKKGTKDYNNEITTSYYGIDPKTFKVRCVSQTRAGNLSMITDSGIPYSHSYRPGDAKAEIHLVYRLIDIVAMPIMLDNSDSPALVALRKKAAQMKADHEAKQQGQP